MRHSIADLVVSEALKRRSTMRHVVCALPLTLAGLGLTIGLWWLFDGPSMVVAITVFLFLFGAPVTIKPMLDAARQRPPDT